MKKFNDLPLDEVETFRFRGRKKKKRKSGWVVLEYSRSRGSFSESDLVFFYNKKPAIVYAAKTAEEARNWLDDYNRRRPWNIKYFVYKITYKAN